jgi:hypothetical protein
LINLFGVYHYDAHSAIVECADFIGRASVSGKLASLPGCREDPITATLPASCAEMADENGLSERDSLVAE